MRYISDKSCREDQISNSFSKIVPFMR